MALADALSRNPIAFDEHQKTNNVTVCDVNMNTDNWILHAQTIDNRCKFIIDVLNRTPRIKKIMKYTKIIA